jgi:polar amino acid transport system substrate-binding protein
MGLRFLRSCACAFFIALSQPGAYAQETIRVVSDIWPDSAEENGQGVYWDLVRMVYEPIGIKVETTIMPYGIGVAEVMSGAADAWLCAYLDDTDWALYSRDSFDFDKVCAAMRTADAASFAGLSSLTGRRTGWMRDYGYDQYLPVKMYRKEFSDRAAGLFMLKQGSIDFFLDNETELVNAVVVSGFADALTTRYVTDLPLYVGFNPAARGKRFKQLWDERIKVIKGTPEYQLIMTRIASVRSSHE